MKHNAKIKDADWEDSMFSLGKYTGKSATGEPVHGSMNDYYKELSYGTLKIEGNFVGWFEVSKKRQHVRGTVGLGHSGNAMSADSQLYIMKRASPSLDGKYAIIGQVSRPRYMVNATKSPSEIDP